MHLHLVPHPSAPPGAVKSVNVQVDREPRGLSLLYIVEGDPARLSLPAPQKPYRSEGLWQTTCFELFVRDAGETYREFNFSPSSQWAAYTFQGYREGRESLPMDEPPAGWASIEPRDGFLLRASIATGLEANARIGISAVIEETDGVKSYWALAHPPGDKPDFHDPACFVLELPQAGNP